VVLCVCFGVIGCDVFRWQFVGMILDIFIGKCELSVV